MIISLLCVASFLVVYMLALCIEVDVFPVCDMIYKGVCDMIYMGTRRIAPHILNLDDRWEWSTSCPGHFTNEKEPQHPLNTRLGEDLVSCRGSLNDLEERKISYPSQDSYSGSSTL